MNVLANEIAKRNLPDLFTHIDGAPVTIETWEKRREEMKDILAREIFGYAPAAPTDTHAIPKSRDDSIYASKVYAEEFDVAFSTPMGEYSFPVRLFVPKTRVHNHWDWGLRNRGSKSGGKPPLLLHINFRPDTPDKYYPVEEITDAGFATARIYYNDVTPDNGDFSTGLAAQYPDLLPEKSEYAWGKIRMWAFAASRLMDVLMGRDDIDTSKVVVMGHSRLGKTALVAAAYDERFAGAISNESGCSGAAITRDKIGEQVADITMRFPYWFCPRYKSWACREHEMPFDHHFLCSLIAPRLLGIGSAYEDSWADPASELMAAAVSSRVYDLLDGIEMPPLSKLRQDCGLPIDRFLNKGESLETARGRVHYHLRPGTHFFSREDWLHYMAFLSRKFFA